MLRIALLAGLLSVSLSLNLSAQPMARTLDGLSPRIYSTTSIHTGDSSGDEKSYIIQFDGPPRLIQQQRVQKNDALSRPAIHAALESDLARIASTLGLSSKAVDVQELYADVFNGALVKAPGRAVAEIRRLPYVVNVVEDGVMVSSHVDGRDDASRPAQGAFPPHKNAEYTGAGVVVAVIDSGVDYTHPDLSGGYLGGYDFVNEDTDPMDDHGHGTHVAGIVAGNGNAFKGTAPDVQFLALKVLDASGKGFDSAVIRAIEHAVNPDGDPLTQDAVDIINLSISSLETGMADHPVTIAVENATAAGVVCVVAAGNRGEEGRASITAPGNARSAITVGAMDQEEEVAAFSSQGPSGSIKAFSRPFFGLKPDIMAPGVQIRSTWLGGVYELRDGTSMASPYVAGLVARVIQRFPEWSPMTIKAHLMQQSRDLGDSIWVQGAGMVDDSTPLSYVVSPACMDFGLVYSSQANWQRSEVLTITNLGTTTSTFTARIRDSLPAGIQAGLSNSTHLLQPGESAEVQLDIAVNPRELPASPFPNGYVGYVDVEQASGIVSVPFSIFKTESVHVQLSDGADHVVLQPHDTEKTHAYVDAPNLTSLFAAPGTYDVLVQFEQGQYTVLKEELTLEASSYHKFSKEDAPNPVTLQAVDIDAHQLTPLSYEALIRGAGTDWLIANYTDLSQEGTPPTLYVSSFSDAYTIEYHVSAFSDVEDYYDIPYVLPTAVDRSIVLVNNPEHLKRFRYQYSVPNGIEQAYFIPWSTQDEHVTPLRHEDLSGFSHSGYKLAPPYEKNVYTSSIQNGRGFGHSIVYPESGRSQKLRDQNTLMRTAPTLLRDEGALLSVNNALRPLQEQKNEGYVMHLGEGNGYWAGELDNSATRFRIKGPLGGGLFRGAWGEAFRTKAEWVLVKDGVIKDYETFEYVPEVLQENESLTLERIVEPGAYTLVIRNEAFLADLGEKGHAVELNFKTDRADPDPPRINALYSEVMEDGKEVFTIDVTDVCNWCTPEAAREQVEKVQLWIKRAAHADWVEEPLERQDSLYVASFDGAYAESYYAMRVRVEDEFENSMDYYTVDESTYNISDPRAVGLLDRPALPSSLTISSVYPNPSPGPVRVAYSVPDPAEVQIFVYDVLGRNVLHVEKHQSAGTYEQELDFNAFASGLYTIQLRVGDSSEVRQVLKVE